MSTWSELEQQFRKLATVMPDARLERQWNESMDDWTLTGSAPLTTASLFRDLATAAGNLLKTTRDVPADVLAETDAQRRWYRALWVMGGPHDEPIMGMMSSYGRVGGTVYVGRVRRPLDVSANLAQQLGRQ